MSELDNKIKEALRQEDAEWFDEIGTEPSVFEMMAEAFQGRHWWLNTLTFVWALVFFVLAIVSAVKFFNTQDTNTAMMWAIGFMFCMMAVAMLKMWFWMELQKNAVTREIKRLELQVARLASRIKA